MRATSLLNPFLTLHAIGRNGYEHENIKYFVAVTIEAKGYKGICMIIYYRHTLTCCR